MGEAEICAAARRLGVFVVAGLIEGTRASWHNTATVIGPDGRILGRQPKCFPTQNEIDNGVVAGKGYRVVETDIGRLGIVICADFAFFSEGVESLVEQGVDIIFNPSWWFALGEAYPATVIGRHMQYGDPVIGVDIRGVRAPPARREGRPVERFPARPLQHSGAGAAADRLLCRARRAGSDQGGRDQLRAGQVRSRASARRARTPHLGPDVGNVAAIHASRISTGPRARSVDHEQPPSTELVQAARRLDVEVAASSSP